MLQGEVFGVFMISTTKAYDFLKYLEARRVVIQNFSSLWPVSARSTANFVRTCDFRTLRKWGAISITAFIILLKLMCLQFSACKPLILPLHLSE